MSRERSKAYRRPSPHTRNLLLVFAGIFAGQYRSPASVMRALEHSPNSAGAESDARTKERIRSMHRRGYFSRRNGEYAITRVGRRIVERERLWSLTIPTPKTHDGLWRVLVFDIPAEKARVRFAFIRHLQRLGLQFYQRSVWVHPYPFENEVKEIADAYGILPHLSFITAAEIDGARMLKKRFHLKS